MLKTAYELANERFIAPRFPKKEDGSKKQFDFVRIAEFSDREDKVLESNETRLIENPDEEREKKERKPMTSVKIQQAETINYGDIMEVYWNGHFLDYGGFARMNRTMAFGLADRNVRVKVEIEPYLNHVNQATQEQLREMSNFNISPKAPKIYGVTVPINVVHGGKRILYTMIETSEHVHKDYAEKLNLMSEIWVATEYGRDILNKSNVTTPIYVMPLGVDTNRYKSNCGTINLGSAVRDFKFLSVFRWSYRKGFDILLRAYMEEFSGEENVSLVLASRLVESLEEKGNQKIIDDFNDIKNSIKKAPEDLPHVALYSKPIEEKDMPKLYNSANAFVLISRGEGFGLPYIEAASCGLPVIGTNCSGQSDFLKHDNSYLVEPDGFMEARMNGNLSRMAKLCHFYEGQIFPDFNRTGVAQTRKQLRHVFENYKEALTKAEKLRRLVASNYTWTVSIDRVYNRLREIS